MEVLALRVGELLLGVSANYFYVLASECGIEWSVVYQMWSKNDAEGLQSKFGRHIVLVDESKVVAHHRGRERGIIYDK